jgi:hypothetical protein
MNRHLDFRHITVDDITTLRPLLANSGYRSCDYTIGGLLLWADYLNYSYCVCDGTLFVMGLSEADTASRAFSLPIGPMPMAEALALIEDYCHRHDIAMRFSAIPEQCVERLTALRRFKVTELADWADYIYDIDALATLAGKKLGKKRNHVNRFFADNPDAYTRPRTADNAPEIVEAFTSWSADNGSASAAAERQMTLNALLNIDKYQFDGLALYGADQRVAAFTLGEVIADTLYVHIEKMDHSITGAGETVNKLFAEHIASLYPGVRYVNREDDAGDPGLRKAKLSYCPTTMLRKFDLRM